FFFSSRRRHTRSKRDWSSDVCSSDLQSVQEVKVREDDMSGLVTDVLASGGQALVFVNTRRSTEALAKSLSKDVRETLGEKELDRSEERRVGKECRARRWRDDCKEKSG